MRYRRISGTSLISRWWAVVLSLFKFDAESGAEISLLFELWAEERYRPTRDADFLARGALPQSYRKVTAGQGRRGKNGRALGCIS